MEGTKKSIAEKIAAAEATIDETAEENVEETTVEPGEAADQTNGTAADGEQGEKTADGEQGEKAADTEKAAEPDPLADAILSQEYYMNDEDFYKFNTFNAFETIHGKKRARKQTVMIFVLLIAAMGIMVAAGKGWQALLFEAVFFAVVLAIFLSRRRVTYRKTLEKAVARARKNGGEIYNPSGTLYFTEDAIVDKGKLTDYSIKYANVNAVYRNVNNLYIYESERRALLVLSHNFDRDEDRSRLWDLLKEKISADKWKN